MNYYGAGEGSACIGSVRQVLNMNMDQHSLEPLNCRNKNVTFSNLFS